MTRKASLTSDRRLATMAGRVVDRLRERNLRLVLAESCTGGLVSAFLTRIPGVSENLCGSAVVYQSATKAQWLGVSQTMLRDPGPVSAEVAARMATGVLRATSQADVAAAVTGHLGPNAPDSQDGLVHLAFAERRTSGRKVRVALRRVELAKEPGDAAGRPSVRRLRRQRSATAHVFVWLLEQLAANRSG